MCVYRNIVFAVTGLLIYWWCCCGSVTGSSGMATRLVPIVLPLTGSGVASGIPSSRSASSNSLFGFVPTPIIKTDDGTRSPTPAINPVFASIPAPDRTKLIDLAKSSVSLICCHSPSMAVVWVGLSRVGIDSFCPNPTVTPSLSSFSVRRMPENGQCSSSKTHAICSAKSLGSDSFRYTNRTRWGCGGCWRGLRRAFLGV